MNNSNTKLQKALELFPGSKLLKKRAEREKKKIAHQPGEKMSNLILTGLSTKVAAGTADTVVGTPSGNVAFVNKV